MDTFSTMNLVDIMAYASYKLFSLFEIPELVMNKACPR